MLLFYCLRLFLLFFTPSLLSVHAMDMPNHRDFIILNKYGKDLQCRLTFEYKEENPSCGDSEIINLEQGHQQPITLSKLKIFDNVTQSIIPIEKLNLAQVIIEAWVPGHELPELPRYEPKESPTQNQKTVNDDASSGIGWAIASSGLTMLKNGLMYIAGQNSQSNEPKPIEEIDDEDSHEAKVVEPLQGCAAVIWPMHIKLIKIVEDPFRDAPMITVFKQQ